MSCLDTYIVVFRGDDTNFQGNQEIVVELQTQLDTTGMKAHFRFLDFQQDFNTIPADKKLKIVIPASSTSTFPLGSFDAMLWLEDSNGKRRTADNRIHVVVTVSVKDAYDNEHSQAITVVVSGGGVPWNKVGKPLTQSDVFDMECSDWQFRKVCARIWTELGGKVENND